MSWLPMNDYHSCIDGGSLRFTIQPNVTASLENHQLHLHAHESICYPYTCSCFFKTEPELNNLFQVLQRLVRKQCHVLLLINKTLAQENNHRLAVGDTRRDVKER